jgi:hypothetical protein
VTKQAAEMVYMYEVVWLCLCSKPFFYFAYLFSFGYGKVDFLSLVLVRYTYILCSYLSLPGPFLLLPVLSALIVSVPSSVCRQVNQLGSSP